MFISNCGQKWAISTDISSMITHIILINVCSGESGHSKLIHINLDDFAILTKTRALCEDIARTSLIN